MTEMQDLARHYEVQTDDQLLRLRQESDELTPEARGQLFRELQKRKLSARPKDDFRAQSEAEPQLSEKVSVLFPSLRGLVATLKDFSRYRRQTGEWPLLSVAVHLAHGIVFLGCVGWILWFGLGHNWSGTRLILVFILLISIDVVAENWIERKVRLRELRKFRRNRHSLI
jgi:hypothetical protein